MVFPALVGRLKRKLESNTPATTRPIYPAYSEYGMDISVIGSGYVGTTLAACLAEVGHEVTAIDIDEGIVAALNDGRAPIEEPGLESLLATHAGDRLTATTSYDAVPDSDVTFLAVGTPSNDDGSIDLVPSRRPPRRRARSSSGSMTATSSSSRVR